MMAAVENSKPVLGYNFALERHKRHNAFKEACEPYFLWIQEIVIEAKKAFAQPEVQLLPKTPSSKKTRARVNKNDSKRPKKRAKKGGKAVKEIDDTSSFVDTSIFDTTETSMFDDSTRSTRSRPGRPKKVVTIAKDVEASSTINKRTVQEEIQNIDCTPPKKLRSHKKSKVVQLEAKVTANKDQLNTPHNEVEHTPLNQLNPATPSSTSTPHTRTNPPRTPHTTTTRDSPVVSTPSSQQHTPDGGQRQSPASHSKHITGFSLLSHVKQKAQAYEEHVSRNSSILNSSGTSGRTDRTLTPRSVHTTPVIGRVMPPRASKANVDYTPKTPTRTPRKTPARSVVKTTDKKNKRSSPTSGRKSASRLSATERRSSHRKSKAKKAKARMTENLGSVAAHTLSSQAKASPSPSSAQRRTTRSKLRERKPTKMMELTSSPGHSDDTEDTATPVRQSKRMKDAGDALTSDDEVKQLKKSNHNLLKLKKKQKNVLEKCAADEPPTEEPTSKKSSRKSSTSTTDEQTAADSEVLDTFKSPAAPKAPLHFYRSQESTFASSEDEYSITRTAPIRGTRSKTRLLIQQSRETPSHVGRPKSPQSLNHQSLNRSMSASKTMPPVRSFLTQLHKQPMAHSFLHTTNNTTPKAITFKEKLAQKRKDMEEKEKLATERVQQTQNAAVKRAEERKKQREERQKMAAQRREDQNKKETQNKRAKHSSTSQINSGDELNKMSKIREKRLHDIEQKRKKDEEARKQRLLEIENEQRRYEEVVKRREAEEMEKQHRLAEQRRIMEEKKHEAEMERRRLIDKQRKEQIQREKQEQEKKRLKEERERRERAEREKIELEKQREKERLRKEQLDREREQERQRIREMEEARVKAQEEKRARATIEKHNQSLNKQKQNTSVGPSNGSKHLNSTFNKSSSNVQSYEITPQRIYAQSDPNNYNIDDLDSGDSTDDDDRPRKAIPAWACGPNFKTSLINQYYNPPDLDKMFPPCNDVVLSNIFSKVKPRFFKRTSSAIWNTPPLKHSHNVSQNHST